MAKRFKPPFKAKYRSVFVSLDAEVIVPFYRPKSVSVSYAREDTKGWEQFVTDW